MSEKPVSAGDVEKHHGAPHPADFVAKAKDRRKQYLGDIFALSQFGVNRVEIDPHVESTIRHWHTHEDEFVYILSGSLTLIMDEGEYTMNEGDCMGFKASVQNGHKLVNRTDQKAVYLEVGARNPQDEVFYSDEDLAFRFDEKGQKRFMRKDGSEL